MPARSSCGRSRRCPMRPSREPWAVPDQNRGLTSAPQLLADTLAEWIAREAGGGVMLESKGRPLRPRRRDGAGAPAQRFRPRPGAGAEVARRAGGRAGPAGADRAAGGAGPDGAGRRAAAAAGRSDLRLPADQPARRPVRRQPRWIWRSGGAGRCGRRCARGPRSGRTGRRRGAFFAALLARVDYVSPHALFAEALGPLGGRARLFARLGPEAAEPVDELLNAALAYGRMHPPSLQGFLHWLRRSGAEVKREAEGAGSLVRVMTVHGAKGLQAPLVILPDTTALPPDEGSILWATDPATGRAVPIWSPRREVRCLAAQGLRDAAMRRRMEEHNRLLYVALTRAEDRLLVCGWQTRRGLDEACWYRLVERGFDALPGERTRSRLGMASGGATPRRSSRSLTEQWGKPRRARSTGCRTGPARHRTGMPLHRPSNRHGRNGWRPAGRRMRNSGRCPPPPRRWPHARPPATGSAAAHCCTRCCSTCPICRRSGAPPRHLPGSTGRATVFRLARPKNWRARRWRILDHPDLAPLFAPAAAPRCR